MNYLSLARKIACLQRRGRAAVVVLFTFALFSVTVDDYGQTLKGRESMAPAVKWKRSGLNKHCNIGLPARTPTEQQYFPLTNQRDVRYFQIDNPRHPPEASYHNCRYCLRVTGSGTQLSAGDN